MITEVHQKIQHTLVAGGWDGILTVGPDNFAYASGTVLPFPHHYPDRQAWLMETVQGQAAVICPNDWAEAIRDQGFGGQIATYSTEDDRPPYAAVARLAGVLAGFGLERGKIGLDCDNASALLMDALRKALPHATWEASDEPLRQLRMFKTAAEIGLIETAARQADRGIIGALNHLEGTVGNVDYTLAEFGERLRVHVYEFGGSGVGHLAVSQGADTQRYYTPAHDIFRPGNLVRMDFTSHHLGYWCNAGRMAVTGEPTPAQAQSFRDNLALKEAALAALCSGNQCCDVFAAVAETAERLKIGFWPAPGIGHGVGRSEAEAPFLTADDTTVLAPGMVLALDIYSYGPERELMHSVDTYALSESGPRLLSWFRDWDRLYSVSGFRASH